MNVRIDRWLLTVVIIVALGYVTLSIRFMDRLDPLTGDEPFYVMTAISILRDGDLDESNNYVDRDFDEFYPPDPLPADWQGWPAFPRTLPPHPATSERSGLHTKHGIGLSLLIAVPYEIAGRAGAVAIVLICGVLVAANMYLLATEARAKRPMAAAIAIMLALSLPIAPYSVLLFPEVPAALLLIYAVRRLAAPVNRLRDFTLIGASIGFLPWLHQRFAPTAVVLALIAIFKLWERRDQSAAIRTLTPIAIGGFALIAYNFWLYGGPLQNTADHAGFNGLGGSINASFGLLLDAQWGLLIAAPIYLVALVGVPLWYRVSEAARFTVIALLPYLVVVATYRVWWGEWGPAARYLVPMAPFAAGALAVVASRYGDRGRIMLGALWGVGAILLLIGYNHPQRLYHHPDGINNLFTTIDNAIGTNIAGHLIAYQPLAQSNLTQRTVGGLVLTLIAMLFAATIYSNTLVPGRWRRQFPRWFS